MNKKQLDFGSVMLVHHDDPMQKPRRGPGRLAMMRVEEHPTNLAALQRIAELQYSQACFMPRIMDINNNEQIFNTLEVLQQLDSLHQRTS